MLEFLQWVFLFALGGAVGWLVRERQTASIPEWLLDLREEDLVTHADLDRYHLRVVQLSQTQKDLIQTRTAEAFARLERIENQRGGSGAKVPPCNTPLPEGGLFESPPNVAPVIESFQNPLFPEADDEDREEEPQTCAPTVEETSPTKSVEETVPLESLPPLEQVVRLSGEGRSVEEIAQNLRMGRQEVQLLLQMAKRRSNLHAGV
jgi:hypothetical protein